MRSMLLMDSEGTLPVNTAVVEEEGEEEGEEEEVTEEKKLQTCLERMVLCSSEPVLRMWWMIIGNTSSHNST